MLKRTEEALPGSSDSEYDDYGLENDGDAILQGVLDELPDLKKKKPRKPLPKLDFERYKFVCFLQHVLTINKQRRLMGPRGFKYLRERFRAVEFSGRTVFFYFYVYYEY